MPRWSSKAVPRSRAGSRNPPEPPAPAVITRRAFQAQACLLPLRLAAQPARAARGPLEPMAQPARTSGGDICRRERRDGSAFPSANILGSLRGKAPHPPRRRRQADDETKGLRRQPLRPAAGISRAAGWNRSFRPVLPGLSFLPRRPAHRRPPAFGPVSAAWLRPAGHRPPRVCAGNPARHWS